MVRLKTTLGCDSLPRASVVGLLALALATLVQPGVQAEPNFILPGGQTQYESDTDPSYTIDWPTVAWTRSAENTTYAEWDTFGWGEDVSSPPLPEDIEPDVGYSGFAEPSDAVVNELTGFAFYTGTKNIYSFSVPIEFEVTLPAPVGPAGADSYFVAQINTIANELDPASVLLSFDGGEQQLVATGNMETQRIPASGFGFDTSEVTTLFWWELPGGSPGDYLLEFKAAEASMSLANLALDAFSLAAESTPGDYDGSGAVDQLDYLTWRSQYGNTVEPYSGADGNGDGRVDAADYSLWRGALPTTAPPAAATLSVPELGAMQWLAMLSVALLFCWGSHSPLETRSHA